MAVITETPTMRALLAHPDLHLRLQNEDAISEDALDAPIRWVHSSDLADPTPFLSDGLVLLTNGTQFHTGDAAPYRDYVRRLSGRGVAALGFGADVVRDGIPTPLSDACRDERMPLFEVPYDTPFIAVARANAEAIAAAAYARRTWALEAQRAIALAALRPDGLGATLAELSRQLGAWVGLYDAAGELSREHPEKGLDAQATDAARDEVAAVLRRGASAGSSLRTGATAFTLQTLGRGGHLRGVIAIAAGDLDQEGRGVVTAVIAMAGLALEQHRGLARGRDALRAGLVQSLLSEDRTLPDRVARQVWGPLPEAPVLIALTDAVSAGAEGLTELLELRVDERRGELFFGRTDDGLVLVVPLDGRRVLDEIVARFGSRIGVADPAGYESFPAAVDQARTARDRGGDGVTDFIDVARAGILSALSPDARAIAAAELAPLTDQDASQGTRLVDTLSVWLGHDCSHETTARALGVHRHTVRARLAQAESVLGRDLSSFAVRAELWAAFRALGR